MIALVALASALTAATVPPLSREAELALLINRYRQDRGLPAVPVSRSLNSVAQAHVRDLMENRPDGELPSRAGPCTMHSWSAKGSWTPVCYTPDNARASGMWSKPREITRGAYSADGFEIAYWYSQPVVPELALEGWQRSPSHDSVIVESGPWRGADWQAMGIGISGNYAVVWFGKQPDKAATQLAGREP